MCFYTKIHCSVYLLSGYFDVRIKTASFPFSSSFVCLLQLIMQIIWIYERIEKYPLIEANSRFQ